MRLATTDAWALSFILAFAGPVSRPNEEPPQSSATLAKQCGSIRLVVVNTPDVLLDALLPQFEEETGCEVTVSSTEAAFDVARAGRADMVIAQYGHSGTEAFVSEGLGLWPRAG